MAPTLFNDELISAPFARQVCLDGDTTVPGGRTHRPRLDPRRRYVVSGSRVSTVERSHSMQKRLVTRYAMKAADAGGGDQKRGEGGLPELAVKEPHNVSSIRPR